MKFIEAYYYKQPITHASLIKNVTNDCVLVSKDFFGVDIVFIRYTADTVEVIINKHGPIGLMAQCQLEEFLVLKDLTPEELNASIDLGARNNYE